MTGYPPAGFPMPTGYQTVTPVGMVGMPPVMPAYPMGLAAPPVAVPMNPDTSGYFGNLSPNISDEVVSAILNCSGGFKRFKRPVDPSSGKFKPFALVEYESVTDLSRAFRLLQDFVLDNRHLNIKLENSPNVTGDSSCYQEEDLKCYEGISRVLIGKKMTSGGSMEWLEKRISQIRKQQQQQQQELKPSDRRDSRQRNYSDLIDDFSSNSKPEATNSKGTKNSNNFEALMSLKDRERRWEGKLKELERELLRDLEKDEEREKRHEKEAAELAEIVSKYSDGNFVYDGSIGTKTTKNGKNGVLFFEDREKWRKIREKAKEKEVEIFGEFEAIRREIQKSWKEKEKREFIENILPIEIEELFAFPVDFNANSKQLLRERTTAFFKRNGKNEEFSLKLAEIIYEKIAKGTDAKDLIKEMAYEPTFLAVSNEPVEAEILIVILWRWLIYYTKFGISE